jgi:Spy/CpxP family protein refolding chaperone
MKTRLLVGALLFLIVVNLATLGTYLVHQFRQLSDLPMGPGRGGPPELAELPQEKRMQVMDLMRSVHTQAMEKEKEIQTVEDSIATLLLNDPVSADRVNTLLRRSAELKYEISSIAVQRLIQAKAFLTPEQQRLLFRAILEARPRMRRQGGFGSGGPPFGPDAREGMPPFGRFGPRDRDSKSNNERK